MRYCERLKAYTRLSVNRMWIVHNSAEIHEYIQKVNQSRRPRNIYTFDVSTLYTTIDHDVLRGAMGCIIDKAFKGNRMETMSIYNCMARWINNPRDTTCSAM